MRKIGALACMISLFSCGGASELSNSCPNGFQVGLGGSYNTISMDQSMTGIGVSNLYSGGVLVGTGEAGGIVLPYRETKSIFSPTGEIGYVHHLYDSPWFLGGKFAYQYVGLTFSNGPIDSPQSGAYTTVSGSDSFFGNAIIQSSQSQVNHELILMPFAGRSLNNTHFYLGAGAAVFQVDFYQYNFIGFADINGVHNAITGKPVNFSNSLWMWGGGGQIGMTHYFTPQWFVDLSYTYLVTANYSFSDTESFSSITHTGSGDYTNIGTALVDATQRIITQSVTVALNVLF